ncbi:hypothetical protein [Opitutus terrae]|uniref:Uncharacterized protein n=1 Tax=Opitutus terrae (strain DSM 11246 / JCM 15787 / PB90-1) TaxID=452637 RepID=B1ZUB0_OPITP|nr:hypothetical protein [Opitutus terrae]ACB76672.1 hypothetical protein Oter_3395 [Opitutus terrae PB90-1]
MMTLSIVEGSISPARVSDREREMLASPEYGALPDHEKPHLRARLQAMERIDAARTAAAGVRAETHRLHAGERLSQHTLRKCYFERWVAHGRDWRMLVNRSRAPLEDREALAPETVLHWHELFFRFSGRGKAAYRELQREWSNGKPIPGLPDRNRPADMPRRLSYATLMREKYKPAAIVKRVARIGLTAAQDLLPSVLQTRVGLAPGSILQFDDVWHDLECSVPGQRGMRRVLQFDALELLSGFQLGRGMKPELLNDKTGRMERLKEREMLFLLAHVLGNRGYNPDGCRLVMELSTATVPERVMRLLHDFSGGKLRVEKGTTSGSPLAEGLYAGRSKGNFRIKAALESLRNLIHNETGDRLLLPAQTGNIGRVNQPDELHGRERHLDQLQRAALLVPAPLRELVTANITPPFAQVVELVDLIQERMNDRTEHELEGWEECGFMAPLFRLAPHEDWRRQTELAGYAPGVRTAIEQALRADPRLVTCRRMSPREVYQERVMPHLTRLPAHLVPALLGMDCAEERRVAKDGRIHFADPDVGPGEHHFEGVAIDEEGNTTVLPDGECYATFVSMLDPERMHVCDAKGRYLGYAPRTLVPTRGDAEAFAKACGQRTKSARERLVPVLRAAAPLMRRDAEAAEQATDLLAQLGEQAQSGRTTPEQRARQKRRAQVDSAIAGASRTADTVQPGGSLYDSDDEP